MSKDATEAAAGCLFAVFILAAAFGVDLMLAWGVTYVGREFFHTTLPYWPTFVAVLVVSFLIAKARNNG